MVVFPVENKVPERGNLGYTQAGRTRKDARGEMSTELQIFASVFVILVLAYPPSPLQLPNLEQVNARQVPDRCRIGEPFFAVETMMNSPLISSARLAISQSSTGTVLNPR
jgi:hypothetical protein